MVPEGWKQVRFGDVVDLVHGFQFRDHHFVDSGVPVVKIGNISAGGEISFANCSYVSDETAEELSRFRIQVGDILMSLTGYIGSVCRAQNTLPHCLQNYRVGKFISKDQGIIGSNFLLHLLSHPDFLKQVLNRSNESAQPNIGKAEIEKVRVPLPPLAEQKKIAEILSTWDRAIEVAEAQLEAARTSKRALMQQLLTGKRRFPEFEGEEWKEVRLGDVADIRIGGTPARKEPSYWQGGTHTWLSIADLGAKYLSASKEMITDAGVQKSNVKLLPTGTVVMSFKLTIGKLGICQTPLYTNEAICGFVPKHDGAFDAEFLYQLLHVTDLLMDVDQAVKGKTLNKAKLNELVVRMPSIEQQRRIAEFLLLADQDTENAETQIIKLRTEKKALMQQLLTGKRRVVV